MKRHFAIIAAILTLVFAPSAASATDFFTEDGFLYDIGDGLASASFCTSRTGVVCDGGDDVTWFDAYDSGMTLRVNGTSYAAPTGTTTAVSGRVLTMPVMTVGSLLVHRIIYVPATGGNYIRYVEVVENPTGADISATIAVNINLGSDGSESVTGSSSGDLVASPLDSWYATDSASDGDPALGFVVQSSDPIVRAATSARTAGNIDFTFVANVPPGGTIAVMHFEIQKATPAAVATEAAAIVLEPESIYFGLASVRDFIINWGIPTAPCAGADGSTCTVTGTGPGLCYGGVCCPGCWDGTRCQSGRAANNCGVSGGLCFACDDEDQCTTNICTAGTCSFTTSPVGTACDDGAFCTAMDACDSTGSCLGTGNPCDDGASCTTDVCDEGASTCTNDMLADTCLIAGMCVTGGTANPTNPCQVCDASRDMTNWSPLPSGSRCGNERCVAGTYDPPGSCNSTGICVVPPRLDCPTGMCVGPVCEGACTATSCASGEYCSSTTLMCAPLIADGGGCAFSSSCTSGFCVDNVCCESECTGTCSRCGGTGRCSLITSGADPDRECPGDDVCDGAGMCRAATMADAGTDTGPLADAGTDAPVEMDAGPEDAGVDGGSFDANIILPDAPFNRDAGTGPVERGCACSAPGQSPGRSGAPLGFVMAIGIALGLSRRRR